MILDIIVIAIFLLSAIIGYKYGGITSILSTLGVIICVALAVSLGNVLSTLIYDNYFSQAIIDNVSDYVATAEQVAVTSTVEVLPSFAKMVVDFTGFETSDAFVSALGSQNDQIAVAVETAMQPLMVMVVSIFSSFVLFAIFYLIFRLFLYKPLLSLLTNSFIAKLDKILGVITSIVGSFILISFVAFLLKLLNPIVDDMPALFTEATIYKSYIFSWFYNGNIFYALTSLK